MSPTGSQPERSADILIVDDDPRSRKLLEGYLRPEGYRIRTAPDGPAALKMALERAPDVALLDIMMPGMTGLAVCQALKNDPDTRLTQVMMVTALDGTADRVNGLDTGADDYVAKPVQRDEFLAKVRALVRARSLLEELESARSELEARNRELEMKKTLAQTLVHDLKNPLTSVWGNLQLLAARTGEENLRIVQRSQSSAKRMQRMILDLLDVECLEEGAYAPAIEAVDLGEIAEEAAREVGDANEATGARLRVEVGSDPCLAEGDANLLRRVLDNLVSNALAHSGEGNAITISVSTRPEGIQLDVADQGPGVPARHRETIFEKYTRLELRDAGGRRNRGLGLTFCRLAVEAQGGSIWVEEAPGGGALFRTVLPAYDVGANQGEPKRGSAWLEDQPTLTLVEPEDGDERDREVPLAG
jgi:signal transduction histidine kinase